MVILTHFFKGNPLPPHMQGRGAESTRRLAKMRVKILTDELKRATTSQMDDQYFKEG